MRVVVLSSGSLSAFQVAVLGHLFESGDVEVAGALVDVRPGGSATGKLTRHLKRGRGGYVLVMAAERLRPGRTGPVGGAREHFERHGVPVLEVEDLQSPTAIEFIRAARPDCIFRSGFGILREPILSLAPRGVISYHHGDLTRYRGLPPAFWELYNGEREMGVTVQVLAEELDAGRIVGQLRVPIEPGDSWPALRERAYRLSEPMIRDACLALADESFEPRPPPALGPLYTYPTLRQWLALRIGLRPGRRARGGDGPVRVVHLGPEAAGRGGMGASIQRLLQSPLADRYRMEAIATWRGTAGPVGRVLIFAAALASFLRWCAAPGRQIVHVHAAVRGSWYRKGVCVAVAKLLRRPVVLQLRVGPGDIVEFDSRIGPLRRAAFRRVFALPDTVVSVSTAGAEEIERRFGRGGIIVISNPAPEPEPAARDLPAPTEPTLLYVGGFHDPAKGGDVFLEALPAIVDGAPGVRITMAGPGELPAEGRQAVEELPAVSWHGWLDDAAKAEAFGTADVFVLPSISEGMPNAMLEAMAHGRAVVATRVGGVPDVVTDGEDGLIVPPGDPARLAEAACRLLGDPQLRARLGEAARARAERLTRDEVWGRLDSVYQELA